MIAAADITVVVQGNLRANTREVLIRVRETLPQARLILSTFCGQQAQAESLAALFDELVLSEDPGALPSTVRSPTAPPNNLNRMLVSSQAGLRRVRTPFAFKLRSDAVCDAGAVVRAWFAAQPPGPHDRLAVPSFYTRHPHGINGYTFHVSDWLTFGTAAAVRRYWDAPPFRPEEACWFDHQPTPPALTATARRFRARFSQEQWLCIHYAAGLGYQVPGHVHDRRRAVVADYARFLAERCVVLDAAAIGLQLPGQAWADRSLFQRLDCVSHADWQELAGLSISPPRPRWQRHARHALRRSARWARHPIARLVLVRKWLSARVPGRLAPPRSSPSSQQQPPRSSR